MGSAYRGRRDDRICRHVNSIRQTSKTNGSGTSCLKEQLILQTWRGAKASSRLARDTKMTSRRFRSYDSHNDAMFPARPPLPPTLRWSRMYQTNPDHLISSYLRSAAATSTHQR